MVRVGSAKSGRVGAGARRPAAGEDDSAASSKKDARSRLHAHSLSALEKSSARVPQGRRSSYSRRGGAAAHGRPARPRAAAAAAGAARPASSRSSEDSRTSTGSDGLDRLCSAVELELSGGGGGARDVEMRGDEDVCCNGPPAGAREADARSHAHAADAASGDEMESEKENLEVEEGRPGPAPAPAAAGPEAPAGDPGESARTRPGGVIVPTTTRARVEHAHVRREMDLGLHGEEGKLTHAAGSSAFERVQPQRAPQAQRQRRPQEGHERRRLAPQEQVHVFWQIQRLQCVIATMEQKYGKGFPEVGRMYLNLARLFSSVSRPQQAGYCLTRSWDTFKANFSVSRSPLSCIGAYRSIFEDIRGGVDPEVERQMASMESMVGAVRRASAAATDMRRVGSAGKRAAALAAAKAPPSTPRKTPGEKQARQLMMSKAVSPLSPRSARANIAANTRSTRTLLAA